VVDETVSYANEYEKLIICSRSPELRIEIINSYDSEEAEAELRRRFHILSNRILFDKYELGELNDAEREKFAALLILTADKFKEAHEANCKTIADRTNLEFDKIRTWKHKKLVGSSSLYAVVPPFCGRTRKELLEYVVPKCLQQSAGTVTKQLVIGTACAVSSSEGFKLTMDTLKRIYELPLPTYSSTDQAIQGLQKCTQLKTQNFKLTSIESAWKDVSTT
jgi:hypothetical protein